MAWDEEDLIDQDQLAFHIVRDIEAQWDMHWSVFYTQEKLLKMDRSKLELPHDWFGKWAVELDGRQPGSCCNLM